MGLLHHHDDSPASSMAAMTSAAASTAGAALAVASSTGCPALPSPIFDTQPITGTLTFTDLSEYIAGITAAVAAVVILALIFMHAMNLSRPAEQLRIIRIVSLVLVYALIPFGSIFLGVNATYLVPWSNVCESIAIISFYRLLQAYVEPQNQASHGPSTTTSYQPAYAPLTPDGSPVPMLGKGSMGMPVNTAKAGLMVRQYFPVSVLVAVVTDLLQSMDKYCLASNSPHYGHIWLVIFRTASVALAVVSVLRATKQLRTQLKPHHIMAKLVGFKLIILINVLLTLIFSFAASHIAPTPKVAYVDYITSIPSMLMCCIMVMFSFAFHFIYRFGIYRHEPSQGGPLGIVGIAKAFNPVAVMQDIIRS